MNSTVISTRGLSKQYRLGLVGTGTLKNDLSRLWHKVRGKEDPFLSVGDVNDRSVQAKSDWVWALRDIDFDVKQGEVLGIIGRNGAGKSTLLKILSKITAPTLGEIGVKGRIASLLEVGTGFHPDLTGRQNVYMNGAILGMRKHEIDRKLEEIVAFSGVAGFIDTPVKRYSSGMKVRLGFAVAAFLEPDILIVDEVLAVGDAEFQKKCLGRMKEVSGAEGRTVLFVSHNLGAVKNITSRCLLLENGRLQANGKTSDVVEEYVRSASFTSGKLVGEQRLNEFWGKEVRITEIAPCYGDGLGFFRLGEDISFNIRFSVNSPLAEDLRIGCTVSTIEDKSLASMMTPTVLKSAGKGAYSCNVLVRNPGFFPGSYKLSISVGVGDFREARKEYDVVRDALVFTVENISELDSSVFNWQPSYGNILHEQVEVKLLKEG